MAFPTNSLRTKGAEMFHAAKSCLLKLQPYNESDALFPGVHGLSQEALTDWLSSPSLTNMWVLRPSETYRSCGGLAKNQHSSLCITLCSTKGFRGRTKCSCAGTCYAGQRYDGEKIICGYSKRTIPRRHGKAQKFSAFMRISLAHLTDSAESTAMTVPVGLMTVNSSQSTTSSRKAALSSPTPAMERRDNCSFGKLPFLSSATPIVRATPKRSCER